jgi:hypothetical protein
VILRDIQQAYMQHDYVFRQVLESWDLMRVTDATVTGPPTRTENVGHKLYMENSPRELFDGYILK